MFLFAFHRCKIKNSYTWFTVDGKHWIAYCISTDYRVQTFYLQIEKIYDFSMYWWYPWQREHSDTAAAQDHLIFCNTSFLFVYCFAVSTWFFSFLVWRTLFIVIAVSHCCLYFVYLYGKHRAHNSFQLLFFRRNKKTDIFCYGQMQMN